ncbi:MAG: hypothetical protein EBV71_07590 [Chitinophagia bacterium]|nr:hypothetical protein [Chitinophagia bacterium]
MFATAFVLSFVHGAPAVIFCAENALSGTVEITKEMMSAVTALAFLWRKEIIAKLWREICTLWSYGAVKKERAPNNEALAVTL